MLPKSLLVLNFEDQYASFDDQHTFVCLCLFVLLLCLVAKESAGQQSWIFMVPRGSWEKS